MDNCIFEIKNPMNQILRVYDDRVEITQQGLRGAMVSGLAGVKTYYYASISTIQFKNCGWTNGFIEFTFAGGTDSRGGAWSGANNDNRFIFGKPTIKAAKALAVEMEKVNDFLQKKVKESHMPKETVVVQRTAADEIMQYKALLDAGAITQEEFEAKKKQLLNL